MKTTPSCVSRARSRTFGLTCGYRKAREHVKFPERECLSPRMLIDIHRCVKPRLHIMDGIVAMEGIGSAPARPRRI